MGSFIADMIALVLAFLVYLMDKNVNKTTLLYIAIGTVICAHGVLHWFLQQTSLSTVIDCYIDKDKIDPQVEKFGFLIFGTFSFLIMLANFGAGFGVVNRKVVVISVFFALLVVWITKEKAGVELILPSLFVVIHPVVSVTGFFTSSPTYSKSVSIFFIAATLVGIAELIACPNFLKPMGGHIMYDIALSSTMLAALPYFTTPAAAKGKKD
ncbi:hypothetical protein ACHAXR_005769 [Thalassiosira sp. AJA248-18]